MRKVFVDLDLKGLIKGRLSNNEGSQKTEGLWTSMTNDLNRLRCTPSFSGNISLADKQNKGGDGVVSFCG